VRPISQAETQVGYSEPMLLCGKNID